jgi:hypothetical protein
LPLCFFSVVCYLGFTETFFPAGRKRYLAEDHGFALLNLSVEDGDANGLLAVTAQNLQLIKLGIQQRMCARAGV